MNAENEDRFLLAPTECERGYSDVSIEDKLRPVYGTVNHYFQGPCQERLTVSWHRKTGAGGFPGARSIVPQRMEPAYLPAMFGLLSRSVRGSG